MKLVRRSSRATDDSKTHTDQEASAEAVSGETGPPADVGSSPKLNDQHSPANSPIPELRPSCNDSQLITIPRNDSEPAKR